MHQTLNLRLRGFESHPMYNIIRKHMKRKQNKIDIVDFNHKIIKSKLKNSLYVLSDLDKELLNIGYKPKRKKKK